MEIQTQEKFLVKESYSHIKWAFHPMHIVIIKIWIIKMPSHKWPVELSTWGIGPP